ncbi:MAG: 50S ribosomal protein L21 [Candidatus Wildermuthbacteria bacterium]|nr:50S ribosomal protein L21 [Candidatus Wildermuthbacteria bacterium]
MFAVIKTGGKQYIVSPGQKLKIEKLPAEAGKEVLFEEVLLLEGEKDLQLGTPLVAGAKVKGKVLKQGKNKKVVVFKFKNKSDRQKRKKGHRQSFTEVEITSISS